MAEGERLFEVRTDRGLTQIEVTGRLGVSQDIDSELERRDDVYRSTRRRHVQASGGDAGKPQLAAGERSRVRCRHVPRHGG